MQDFTLHTHTNEFDGRNTPAQMVARAQEMGLKAIGISNHFIVWPGIKDTKMYSFAVRGGYQNMYSESFETVIRKFMPHYQELAELAEKSGVRVLRGLEVDYFHNPRWYDGFADACEKLRPDYLIGAAHFVEHNGALCNIHDIFNAPKSSRHEMLQKYWYNVSYAAESRLFNWMAHLDLPKKVGLCTDDMYAKYEEHAVRCIAKADGAMELNTSAPNGGVYPSDRILKMAARQNIPVLVSDDAHCASDIGRNFDAAEQFARKCGITKFAKLGELVKKR